MSETIRQHSGRVVDNPGDNLLAEFSSVVYKEKSIKIQQIGKELGVRYILEGSVQKVGDRVRITAQLIDTTTGYHIWSENYDRQLSDMSCR
jgi:adenylate cyclase